MRDRQSFRETMLPCVRLPLLTAYLLACSSGNGAAKNAGAMNGGQTVVMGESAGTIAGGGGFGDGGGGSGGGLGDGGSTGSIPACTATTKSIGAKACTSPFLTWTGSDLLALWMDSANDIFRGARIAPDGTTVSAPWTSSVRASWCHFGAAWTGDRAALLYVAGSTTGTGADHFLAALDEDGTTVLAPQSITTSHASAGAEGLRWNGSVFGASWIETDEKAVRFAELSPLGVPTYAAVTATKAGVLSDFVPAAAGGWWFLVANLGLQNGLIPTRLGADGAIAASAQTTDIKDPISSPKIVSSSAGTFVAYGDNNDEHIHVRRLDEQTVTLGTDRAFGKSGYRATLSMLWNGQRFGVAWYDQDYGSRTSTLYFVELDSNGVPIGAATTVGNAGQGGDVEGISNRPDWLTWTGDRWALAWLATRDVNDLMVSTITCPGS